MKQTNPRDSESFNKENICPITHEATDELSDCCESEFNEQETDDEQFDREETYDWISNEDDQENDGWMDDWILSEDNEENDDGTPSEDYEKNDDQKPKEDYKKNNNQTPTEDYEKIVDEQSNFGEGDSCSNRQENHEQSYESDGSADYGRETDDMSDVEETNEQSDHQEAGADEISNQKTNKDSVQILSIQWLTVQKIQSEVEKKCSLPEFSLSKAIKVIVDNYNEQRKDKKTEYLLEKEGEKGGYLYQRYIWVNEFTTSLARQGNNPESTRRIHFIYFFYKKELCNHIFALTSGDAWRVVRRYVSPSFPVKVLEKVGNPKVPKELGRRRLFGRKTTLERYADIDEGEFLKTANLYYLVEYLSCEIKNDSSLSQLIDENGRFIMIRTGGILRILKRLAVSDYPRIFNKLAEYMDGTPTHNKAGIEEKADCAFEFLHFLQPACSKEKHHLDNLFVKSIYQGFKNREELDVQISHTLFVDFLCATSYKIQFGSRSYRKIRPPTIKEIVERCGVNTSNEKTFIEQMQRTKLSFTNQAAVEQTAKPIIDCIEGRLHDSGDTFYKMKGKWFVLDADYLVILNEAFKKVYENSWIKENTEGWLHLLWPSRSSEDSEVSSQERENIEGTYNRSYLNEEERETGFLVFDQILPDNIEPCDILKYCKDSNTLYLYQVKEKLGNQTRVACAQILDAATEIQSALQFPNRSPNYLEKLWDKATILSDDVLEWRRVVKGHLEALGKTEFMNMFQNPNVKIVFVYAYVPLENRSFSTFLEKSKEPIGEKITKKLINAGYLDLHHRLTGKFYAASENTFKLDVKSDTLRKKIYRQLAARRFSLSTAAKIQLVHLERNLRMLGFRFGICELLREKGDLNNKAEKELAFDLPGPSSQRKTEPRSNRKRSRRRSAKEDFSDKRQKRMTDFFSQVKPLDEESN